MFGIIVGMKILYAFKIKVGKIIRYIVEENAERAHARFNIENDLGDWNFPLRYLEKCDIKMAVHTFLPGEKYVVPFRGRLIILHKANRAYQFRGEFFKTKAEEYAEFQ